MFVTFYSYKGGVGRTMALANIACLLAQDQKHPQRVLLIDLDLDAPGLHKLFPPPSRRSLGFVDFAFEFASTGTFPDLDQYIYKSRIVEHVDVLQAGQVGPEYCQKLQSINWPSFFGDDPTDNGAFFGKFIDAISQHNYDYVLIDSRTGLSDQAGITTQVLPDMVLMIFRLTEQNLDGLSHLYAATRASLKIRKRQQVEIMPVASLVFSKASHEIDKRRDRACEIFGVKQLEYIRFDPDLVSEEQLFCLKSNQEKMWPVPPVVDDYLRLCGAIREKNQQDIKTVERLLRKRARSGDVAALSKMLLQLVANKPALRTAWDLLHEYRDYLSGRLESLDELAHSIQNANAYNSFALEWIAGKFASEAKAWNSESLEKSRECLHTAIEHDKKNVRLYEELAEVCAATGDIDQAIVATKTALSLTEDNIRCKNTLALLYVRRGTDYLRYAKEVLRNVQGESKYPLFAYLASFLGSDRETSDAIEAIPQMNLDWHREQGFIAHCLLLQGRESEALELARNACASSDNPPDNGDLRNWAEVFVCGEAYDEAIRIGQMAMGDDERTLGIIELARYLSSKGAEPTIDQVRSSWKLATWNFSELLLFRERLKRDRPGQYDGCLEIFELLVRDSLLHDPSDDRKSIFWRRRPPRFGRSQFIIRSDSLATLP